MPILSDFSVAGSDALVTPAAPELDLALPTVTDAVAVHDLIAACPPLDGNSLYASLLQCSHFASTCAVAHRGNEVVGWVSGYIEPAAPQNWFLWQVAVAAQLRGQALAQRLIAHILARECCREVRYLEATITAGNDASWGLFQRVADGLDAPLESSVAFERQRHFGGRHDTEMLVRIGPFVAGPHSGILDRLQPTGPSRPLTPAPEP